MKNTFSPFPIHSYGYKVFSAFFTVAALGFLVWLSLTGNAIAGMGFSQPQQLKLATWLVTFGLFGVVFSKEKIEDERVSLVRQFVMGICFRLFLIMLISVNLVAILNPKFEVSYTLEMVLFCLAFYLVIFYGALFFNPGWVGAEPSVSENMRIKPKFYLIFALIQVALLIVLFCFA
jgi:hypothetical protein